MVFRKDLSLSSGLAVDSEASKALRCSNRNFSAYYRNRLLMKIANQIQCIWHLVIDISRIDKSVFFIYMDGDGVIFFDTHLNVNKMILFS